MDTQEARSQRAEVVGAARETAQEQASQAVQKGRGVVRSQVETRSTQAGHEAQSVAETLRQTATQLRVSGDEQQERYAQIADRGAERLDSAGRYLADSDADELLGKLEEGARRQPWLVVGGGVLLGIAAARFLKASSSERYYRTQAAAGPRWDARYGGSGETWEPGGGLTDVGDSRPLVPATPTV